LRFDFIRRHKKAYPVAVLCKLLQVSRSGFYDFQKHRDSGGKTDPEKAKLEARVKEIFRSSRKTYGSRRIMKQLRNDGYEIGRYQVRSLMRKLGLKAKVPRRYKVTTDSNHNHPIAPNLLDRQFNVDAPNKVWTTDITYVWTLEGWIHLAVVMDLFSRQIVGWAMDKRMKTRLVMDALAMAFWRRKPDAGLLHHSDRGSQYASGPYRSQLQQWQMIASMSRKGDCWDNAPTERFFRSLKSEHLVDFRFSTREMAVKEILEYITFYNAYRLHSTLGYESPLEYEKRRLLEAA
jgi:transposase InsO family protein